MLFPRVGGSARRGNYDLQNGPFIQVPTTMDTVSRWYRCNFEGTNVGGCLEEKHPGYPSLQSVGFIGGSGRFVVDFGYCGMGGEYVFRILFSFLSSSPEVPSVLNSLLWSLESSSRPPSHAVPLVFFFLLFFVAVTGGGCVAF